MKSLSPEEAIAILSDMKIDIPVPKAAVTQKKRNVALDMAIDALKYSEMPNSSDTISRRAAIDAVADGLKHTFVENQDIAEKLIGKLPSAQSELENKILAIGYTGKEGRIYIGGRLFAVRELA